MSKQWAMTPKQQQLLYEAQQRKAKEYLATLPDAQRLPLPTEEEAERLKAANHAQINRVAEWLELGAYDGADVKVLEDAIRARRYYARQFWESEGRREALRFDPMFRRPVSREEYDALISGSLVQQHPIWARGAVWSSCAPFRLVPAQYEDGRGASSRKLYSVSLSA